MRELPEGWTSAPVGKLFKIYAGGTPDKSNPKYWGGTIPWLSSGDIKGPRITGSSLSITEEGLKNSSAKMCRAGSILLVVRSGVLKHTLPVSILEIDAAINQDIKCLDSGDDELNGWLALELRSSSSDILTQNREGTTVQSVKTETITSFELAIPPRTEQRRIVAKLDALLARVNACRERLDKVPKLIARFRQSVLSAACTGKLTAEWRQANFRTANHGTSELVPTTEVPIDIPESWTWKTNVDLARPKANSICAGPFGTIFKAKDFRQDGVPIIFLRHVAPGRYLTAKPGFMDRDKWLELFQPYSVHGGELLITKLGDPPGTCCLYPKELGPAMVTPDVIKMDVDDEQADPRYLMYYFNSTTAKNIMFGLAFGVTRLRIDLRLFKSLLVPVPPLSEQKEIVRKVTLMLSFADKIEARYRKALANIEGLSSSILAKAFAGQLVPTEEELARTPSEDRGR